MVRLRRGIAALAFSLFMLSAAVGAQGTAPSGPKDDDTFVAAKPGEGTEQLPATPLVFGAYAVVWVGLLLYVFSLWRRIQRTDRELAEVTSKLEAREP